MGSICLLGLVGLMADNSLDFYSGVAAVLVIVQSILTLCYIHDVKDIKESSWEPVYTAKKKKTAPRKKK